MSAPAPSPHSPIPPANLLTFLRLVGQLKTTKRTGWVNNNIPLPESVADHMYRMSVIAMAVPHKNSDKLVKLALAHDLAECMVGDITPHDGVSKEEKRRREEEAMRHIRDDVLGGAAVGIELYGLWKEYDDGETEDARLMKEIDKFEMILQADEYERAGEADLGEFFEGTKGVFRSEVMRGLDEELRCDREKRIQEAETRRAEET